MTLDTAIALIGLAGSVVAAWIKQNADVAKLKEKIRSMEKTEARVEDALQKLTESMNRVERALVKAGLIDVD